MGGLTLGRVCTALVATAAIAGCGSADASSDQARETSGRERDPGCQASVRSALAGVAGLPGPVASRLISNDPVTGICAYSAGRERVTVEVHAIAEAYRAYITTSAHQVQANTGLGGAVPRSDYPRAVPRVGSVASWLPQERVLYATNAHGTHGGAFLRVTIRSHQPGAPADRKVAAVVARASLRTAPRGPDSPPEHP